MRIFIITILSAALCLPAIPAVSGQDGSGPAMVVDWLDRTTRRVSIKIDPALIDVDAHYAVLDSVGRTLAHIYPHELLTDRFWSQSLRIGKFEKLAIGLPVVPAALSPGSLGRLREEGHHRTNFYDTLVEVTELEDEVWDIEQELERLQERRSSRLASLTSDREEIAARIEESWDEECQLRGELQSLEYDSRVRLVRPADSSLLREWGQDEVITLYERTTCYPVIPPDSYFPFPVLSVDAGCCREPSYQAVGQELVERELEREKKLDRYLSDLSRDWEREEKRMLDTDNRRIKFLLEEIEDFYAWRERRQRQLGRIEGDIEYIGTDLPAEIRELEAEKAGLLRDIEIHEARIERMREKLRVFEKENGVWEK